MQAKQVKQQKAGRKVVAMGQVKEKIPTEEVAVGQTRQQQIATKGRNMVKTEEKPCTCTQHKELPNTKFVPATKPARSKGGVTVAAITKEGKEKQESKKEDNKQLHDSPSLHNRHASSKLLPMTIVTVGPRVPVHVVCTCITHMV